MIEIKEAKTWNQGDPVYSLIGIGNAGSDVVDKVENTFEYEGIDFVKIQKESTNPITVWQSIAIIADMNEKDCFDLTIELLDSIRKNQSKWWASLFLIVIDFDQADDAKFEMLEERVDHLIAFRNDLCMDNTKDMLYKCTYSLVVPILSPSPIGMDYADYIILLNKGTPSAWFGFGSSSGSENRHVEAADIALESKLVKGDFSDCTNLWVYIVGDICLIEANEVANHVLEKTRIDDENILFQCAYDESENNEACVFIIAF